MLLEYLLCSLKEQSRCEHYSAFWFSIMQAWQWMTADSKCSLWCKCLVYVGKPSKQMNHERSHLTLRGVTGSHKLNTCAVNLSVTKIYLTAFFYYNLFMLHIAAITFDKVYWKCLYFNTTKAGTCYKNVTEISTKQLYK